MVRIIFSYEFLTKKCLRRPEPLTILLVGGRINNMGNIDMDYFSEILVQYPNIKTIFIFYFSNCSFGFGVIL